MSSLTGEPTVSVGKRPSVRTASVVIPVFNEEDNISALASRLSAAAGHLPGVAFQIIFVNDGSSDGSADRLNALAEENPAVVVLHLSRNFGHQNAVSAGIAYSTGDVVCLIDADLQDPPELLPDMIREIDAGYDIVYGVRISRARESWIKLVTAKLFYRLLRAISNVDIPADTGDFRVMRRSVARMLCQMPEKHRFLRGMVAWTGFRSKAYPYNRQARHAGQTKYPMLKMVRFALNAIFAFSTLPLRVSNLLGLLLTAGSLIGIIYIIVLDVFFGKYIPGVSSTLLAVLLLGGVQLMSIGILGEYIGRIFEQVKDRPLYIIADVRGLPAAAWQNSPPTVPESVGTADPTRS
jgi:polyisoprenyl-phosphate glycosyltransferase